MSAQQQDLLFYGFAPVSNAVYTYGRYLPPVPGFNAITTSGSNTTITGVASFRGAASTAPFAGFTVGTLLFKRTGSLGTAADINIVTTATSQSSIVVATARNYSASPGGWWHQIFLSGTTDSDGWMMVGNARRKAVKISVTALASAGVRYSIEGKGWNLDVTPYQILTGTITSAAALGNSITVNIAETVAAIRVGLQTSSGGPSASDAVTVSIIERVGPLEMEG